MHRSKALVILTRQLRHVCPYRGQDVPVALCYKKSQDIEERDYCYGCGHVEVLKRKYGLRTFVRRIVLSRCKHCDEPASTHGAEPPHKGPIPSCVGFEPYDDEGVLYVPTNRECTEWMVVDVATGVRRTLAEYKGDKRYKLPLVGAPGTVPPDGRDEARREAAADAARQRMGRLSVKTEETEEGQQNTTVKVTRGRRKSR